MSTPTSKAVPGVAAVPPGKMRKVAAASFIGTAIEYYDLLIYGTAAALVFPHVFFPDSDPNVAVLASFATFAVAFFARPVGSVIFGHFGDRIGRKRTLVWTLLIMGFATVMIGFLPGYSSGVFGILPGGIGALAPILLVLLRFLQGFAVGGEWAGAALLTAEYSPPKKRGLYAMFPQLGPAAAFIMVSATFLVVNLWAGETSTGFLEYGWRVPFLLSAVLVVIGLWVRVSIEETPSFQAMKDSAQSAEPANRFPFMEVIRKQPKEILLAGGALAGPFAMFYMGTTFLTSYGTANVGVSRTLILSLGVVAGCIFFATIAIAAVLSDRIGRRPVVLMSCCLSVPWTLVLFPLLNTGNLAVFCASIVITLIITGIGFGPAAAFLPELFESRYRYTGAGLGYNLAGILGGAIPPIIATQLIAGPGSIWVGVMLAVLSLVSVLCLISLKETLGEDMD